MPLMTGIDATRALLASYPDMVIIGLSMYKEDHREVEMREAGAAAYVSKEDAADVIVSTIRGCVR
jgi:NarL family two-component system response regulator LiaR